MKPEELTAARRRAEEARERARKATEGPWTVDEEYDAYGGYRVYNGSDTAAHMRCNADYYENALDNANFAARARDDVPELASLVAALVGEVEGLTRGLRGLAVEHEKLSRRLERSEAALREAGLFLQVMVDGYATDMAPEAALMEVRAALSGGEREEGEA